MLWLLCHHRKSPHYPMNRRLGGYQSQSGCCEEGKISSPDRNQNPSSLVVQSVAQLLYWLRFNGTQLDIIYVSMQHLLIRLVNIWCNKCTSRPKRDAKIAQHVFGRYFSLLYYQLWNTATVATGKVKALNSIMVLYTHTLLRAKDTWQKDLLCSAI
jgi:hypothetical protein